MGVSVGGRGVSVAVGGSGVGRVVLVPMGTTVEVGIGDDREAQAATSIASAGRNISLAIPRH